MEGHSLWQIASHNGYLILTIIGVVVVLAIVYRKREKAEKEYKRRAKGDE